MITQPGKGFLSLGLLDFDGVLQSLGPEHSSLDDGDVIRPGADYRKCVFGQGLRIRQATASGQVIF